MEFLRNKISEEEEKVDLENTGEDFSHELEESVEMETEFDQTAEPDLKKKFGEETDRGDISEVTTDDIFSILQRYQHLDGEDIEPETTVAEDIVDFQMEVERGEHTYEDVVDKIEEEENRKIGKTFSVVEEEFQDKEISKENIQPVGISPNIQIEGSEYQTEPKEENLDNEKKEGLNSKDLSPTETQKEAIGIGQTKMKSKADKSFFCPECAKSFTQKSNMKAHYKSIHQGMKADKSFSCPECGKRFTQKCNMNVHYKSVHEGMKYPCRLCEFVTIYPSNLPTHVKSVHGGVNRKRPIQTGN